MSNVSGPSITIDAVNQALERWRAFNAALGGFALIRPIDTLTQLRDQITGTGTDRIDIAAVTARQNAALHGPSPLRPLNQK